MEMGRDRHLTENLLELASCFRGRTHRGLTFLFRRFFFFFSNLRQNSVLVCQGKPLDRLRKKKCFLIIYYWNCLTFSMSTTRFLVKCHTFLEMSRFSKYVSFLVSCKVSSPVFLECLFFSFPTKCMWFVTRWLLFLTSRWIRIFFCEMWLVFQRTCFLSSAVFLVFLQVLGMFCRRCFLHLTMYGCIFDKTSFVPQ